MALIAVEEHWMLPQLADALHQLPPNRRDDSLAFNHMGDHAERLADLGPGRLATMDDQGIDMSVLALTPPGAHPLDPADAVRLCRSANDRATEAVRAHPDRFRSLSTLPMSSPADAPQELARAAREGHVGAMVYGRAGDILLDDPAHDELFAAAAELGQPIFLHPQLPSLDLREASYRGFGDLVDLGLATFGWGWHLDAALAALRLILRGTFDRHPDLQVILGHWGEMLLFWTDRANGLARLADLDRPVSDYLATNFFITMSGMFNPALLHHALTVTTIDRLIFSTDYPFQHPTRDDITAFLNHFETDADRALVSATNAARLFNIAL